VIYTTPMIRTPEKIEPNRAPGGVVVRRYLANGFMVAESFIKDPISAETQALLGLYEVDLDPRHRDGFCLAFYDGDTGERFPPDQAFGPNQIDWMPRNA